MKSDMFDGMSNEEIARWLLLLEGSDFIFAHLEEKNVSIDAYLSDNSFLKKINRGLNKYIKERFPTMLHDVEYFKSNNGGKL